MNILLKLLLGAGCIILLQIEVLIIIVLFQSIIGAIKDGKENL